jgi:CheY-like chemotaxis protein
MADSVDAGRYVVLVVESDGAESAAICETLALSFDVIAFASGQEAIQALRASTAHVICAAYPVPGMDSVRFLQRAASVTDPPCMLFLTSAAELRDKKLEGLSGVVAKPCDPQALLDRVSRLCQVAETRRRVNAARNAIGEHQKRRFSAE